MKTLSEAANSLRLRYAGRPTISWPDRIRIRKVAKRFVNHLADVSRFAGAALLAIVVALLSFLGSLGGTYWAARLQREDRETERLFEQRRATLEKQINLIERTVTIINRGGAIGALRAAQTGAVIGGIARAGTVDENLAQMARAFEKLSGPQKELAELESECAVVLSLDALFFGPRTRDAIKVLAPNGSCWSSDGKLQQNLLEAMNGELGGFPYADTRTK
jgi:hypothetical protein